MRSCLRRTLPLVYRFLLGSPLELPAETRRALLVSIDTHQPAQTMTSAPSGGTTAEEQSGFSSPRQPARRGTWYNLDGAVNDVEARRAVLEKYGLQPDNTHVLKNAEASREHSLMENGRNDCSGRRQPGRLGHP